MLHFLILFLALNCSTPKKESRYVKRIAAAFDGNIYFGDSSDTVVNSFSTGLPIYAPHHILSRLTDFDILSLTDFDCTRFPYSSDIGPYSSDIGRFPFSSDIGKKILSLNPEDLIEGTLFISDEVVTVGRKEITAFEVDAKTGRLIRTSRSSASQSTEQADGEKSAQPHLFIITRTDYTLCSSYRNSNKDLWRMKVVDIEYKFTSQNSTTMSVSMTHECGPAINSAFKMPLANQSKVVIQRFQQIDDDTASRLYLFRRGEVAVILLPSNTEVPNTVETDTVIMPHDVLKHLGSAALSPHLRSVILPDFIYQNALGVKGEKRHFENLNSTIAASRRSELVDSGVDGYQIGKIFVSTREIAEGSSGTTLFKGRYEDREVAVKRFDQHYRAIAFKEIKYLNASDQHPNIVRYHGREEDENFVYIALELYTCSLDDLIQIPSNSEFQSLGALVMRMMELRKANVQSPLLKLMRDMVSGLAHLHELGIIHGNLNNQNVLILVQEQSISAKLSDMCSSKHLHGGYRHPAEAKDLHSLGLVFRQCIVHGLGEGNKNVFFLHHKYNYEAEDIIIWGMLNCDPKQRPSAVQVLHHPLFWGCEMRRSFFFDVSDRLKSEDEKSALLEELESVALCVIGRNWKEKLSKAFETDINQRGSYRFDSVQELLRYIKNKLSHFEELSEKIKEIVGRNREGLIDYFASQFPTLLIVVYKVVSKHCGEEESLKKYFESRVD